VFLQRCLFLFGDLTLFPDPRDFPRFLSLHCLNEQVPPTPPGAFFGSLLSVCSFFFEYFFVSSCFLHPPPLPFIFHLRPDPVCGNVRLLVVFLVWLRKIAFSSSPRNIIVDRRLRALPGCCVSLLLPAHTPSVRSQTATHLFFRFCFSAPQAAQSHLVAISFLVLNLKRVFSNNRAKFSGAFLHLWPFCP